MSDDFDLVRGSGNVFRDFGHVETDVMQLKAILAGRITDVLDAEKMSVRQAHELTALRPPTSRGYGRPGCNASPSTG